jgi:hypothetical protein
MRVFSDLEKQLLRRIESGEGRNLYSLIDPWIRGVSFRVKQEAKKLTIVFQVDDPIKPTNLNRERIQAMQTLLIQAVNIIKLFEDKGYFFTYEGAHRLKEEEFTFGQAVVGQPSIPYEFPDSRVSELFCKYASIEIFVTPELKKFIEDDFRARDEVRADRQYERTGIALVVAIVGLLINLGYNIYKDCKASTEDHHCHTSQCHGH